MADEPRIPISIRLPLHLYQWLKSQDMTASKIMENALESYMKERTLEVKPKVGMNRRLVPGRSAEEDGY